MKILYFHQHFSTPDGSVGTRSYENGIRLLEAGHKVIVVCGSYDGGVSGIKTEFNNGIRRGMVDGLDVIELELPYSNYDGVVKRSWIFLRYALRGLKFAFSERYDILFATSTPLTAAIPGIIAKLLLRKPFVFEVRDLWPAVPREMKIIRNPVLLWFLTILEYISYHCSDGCIALSPGMVNGIEKRGVSKEKIKLIPNGCDLNMFGTGRKFEDMYEQKSIILENDFVLLYAGTHGLANGLDSVLDAASVLCKKGRDDIKFVFIGDGKMKPHLLLRKEKEGLKNCIFFEPMAKKKLIYWFSRGDAGLLTFKAIPILYTTSPNKFFDYIAAGLPVIINYPGWIADLVEEHDCGRTVTPGDPVLLSNTIEYLADLKQEELAKMGIRARALAEQSFDRKKLTGQFVGFLEKASKSL